MLEPTNDSPMISPRIIHETALGHIINGDSLDVLAQYDDQSVDLIMTSPPFGLVRKKDYGNVAANEYVEWFKPFGKTFKRILKDSGSLVIDIGGAWNEGYPTRNLYHFKLLIMLCEEIGFHLGSGILLVEPVKTADPGGVGHRSADSRQGRRQYGLVAGADALAEGQQSTGVAALQPQYARAAEKRLQGEKASFRPRYQRQIQYRQRCRDPAQPDRHPEHGEQQLLPALLRKARLQASSRPLSGGVA